VVPYRARPVKAYAERAGRKDLPGSINPDCRSGWYEIRGDASGTLQRLSFLGPRGARKSGLLDMAITYVLSRMTIEVAEYETADGTSSFREWFLGISANAKEAVLAGLDRMQLGNLGDTRSVGGGVLERRIHSGPGYRI